MEYQDDLERGRKIKILTVATIAALIVLALGAWAIIAAVSSAGGRDKAGLQSADPSEGGSTTVIASESERKAAESKEQTTAESKEQKAAESKNNASSTNSATTSNSTASTSTSASSTSNASTASSASNANTSGDIPYTGPADTALATFLIGAAVYLLVLNQNLKKSPRKI